VADADASPGDVELLGPAVSRERLAEALDIDPGNEEVRVLRVDAEELVADRAADDVRV
jgi:hypothetical protein